MTTRRIQRLRHRGWRAPAGVVNIGRPSRWASPYRAARTRAAWAIEGPGLWAEVNTRDLARQTAVAAYRDWLSYRPDLVEAARAELAGRTLMCWCREDAPCHGDVLARVADGGTP